jgi:Flp pilus assembly protein TadG
VPTELEPGPRGWRQRRGAAAVEFALVLPVLVTILIGATDFGRCYYSAIAVTNAARAGAAYGCMNPYDSSNSGNWQAGITQAVSDELSQSAAFDTSQLTVNINTVTESSGLTQISVQVTYPFTTVVSWPSIPSSFNLSQTVVLRGIR